MIAWSPHTTGIAAGVGVTTAVFGLLLLVYLKARRASAAPPHDQAHAAARRLERLAASGAELEELAGRIDQELARRLSELRELLARIDGKLDQLRRLADRPAAGDGADAPAPRESKRQEALRLAERGADPVEIARRLDMDVGEVQLLINIKRHGGA